MKLIIRKYNFISNLMSHLLNANVNMDIVYFEINHRNKWIYILICIEVKNNKILLLIQQIGLLLFNSKN